MTGALLVSAGAALLAATSLLAAATVRLPSFPAYVLGAYVFAWAEVVLLTLLLSSGRAVSATGYLVGQSIVAVAVAAAWTRAGRPRPPLPRPPGLASLRAHPVAAGLALVVATAVAYEAAVALTTAATNVDELWYHLPRAAAWFVHGGVHHIPGGNVPENAYPPNGEIGVVYTFALLGHDALAPLPQLVAQLALVTAIYGLARKLGSSRPAALFE